MYHKSRSTYPLQLESSLSNASRRFRSSIFAWDNPAAKNSCHRIVVFDLSTLSASKSSSTSRSVSVPSAPASAFCKSTILSDCKEISPTPSVSIFSNSCLRSTICSVIKVKLKIPESNFFMSDDFLKSINAATVFGLRRFSSSGDLQAQTWIHSSHCNSLALGLLAGSGFKSLLTKAFPVSLTPSHASCGSKTTSARRLEMTKLDGTQYCRTQRPAFHRIDSHFLFNRRKTLSV